MASIRPACELLDQRYRPLSQSKNKFHSLDVYVPESRGDADERSPVVVFVHGGGWKDFDKRGKVGGHQQWGKALSTAGIVTVLPGYRKSVKVLYPTLFLSLVGLVLACTVDHAAVKVVGGLAAFAGPLLVVLTTLQERMPHIAYNSFAAKAVDFFSSAFAGLCNIILSSEQIEHPDHCRDVASSIRWVVDNIAKHGGDPSQIVLVAHSAGAHISAMLMLQPQLLRNEGIDSSIIKGLFLVSGPYSAKRMYESIPMRFLYMHPAFGRKIGKWDESFPVSPCSDPKQIRQLQLPRFYLANAVVDFGLELHAIDLAKLLRAGGVTVDTVTIAGTNHASISGGIGKEGSEAQKELMPLILKFIKDVTGEVAGQTSGSTEPAKMVEVEQSHEQDIGPSQTSVVHVGISVLLIIEAVCMVPIIIMLSACATVASIAWYIALCGGSRSRRSKHPPIEDRGASPNSHLLPKPDKGDEVLSPAARKHLRITKSTNL